MSSPAGPADARRARAFARPPRVRVEWLIAGTRVLLAGGGLLIVAIGSPALQTQAFVLYLLSWYLVYSLGMLALVWAPIEFAPGWAVAVHLFDFAAFALLIATTGAAGSPFFLGFLFLLVCGTLRWQATGTLWTAVATIVTYAGVSLVSATVLGLPGFGLRIFLIRTIYLGLISAIFATLSAHQRRFQGEIAQMASWPRQVSRDPRVVVSEILSLVSTVLEAPGIVLVWDETGKQDRMIAWLSGEETQWDERSRSEYDPLVLPILAERSFQASDATSERGAVVVHARGGFRRRRCRPINEAFRARFDLRAVQSWPFEGELVRGRIFCVNKSRMGIDELVVGELVASQVASRLDSTLMLERLRDAAALDERVRVAGDLHDSLLQAQAGAALQLLAARRLLDQRPDTARQGLEEVQNLLERGELEMRSFIRGLRPASSLRPAVSAVSLADRLDALREKVDRQWSVTVDLRLAGAVDRVPPGLHDDVYHLTQEAVINAARHAEASSIRVTLSVAASDVSLEVVDDGRGFPFHGTFDLDALNRMMAGPLTLKERVGRLAGDLTLASTTTGTTVRMKLPLDQKSH